MSQTTIVNGLLSLILEMGRLIRELDENEDHSALWTQDGDYVADKRFAAAGADGKVQQAALGEVSRTDRGFEVVRFRDECEREANIQCSSLAGNEVPGSSFLWMGLESADPQIMAKDAMAYGVVTSEKLGWVPYTVPDAVQMQTRMHLSRQQVQGVIERLQTWLDTGRLGASSAR